MPLTAKQYLDIQEKYDKVRQHNHAIEEYRKQEVYSAIPRIQQIDVEIAHRKVAAAKYRLMHSEPDARLSIISEVGDLRAEKAELLRSKHFPENYLDPIYQCNLCKDEGKIANEKCKCFYNYVRKLYVDQSNLKDFMYTDNFDHFSKDYYSRESISPSGSSPYTAIEYALKAAHDFVDNFSLNRSQNMLIHGNTGVGKTFLSHCIGVALLEKNIPVLYLTAYQLFSAFSSYRDDREQFGELSRQDILNTELLIIDDLGTELNNAYDNSRFFLCVNERLINNRSTIISSNLTMNDIRKNYSERVASRIIDAYTVIHILGDDIRVGKKYKGFNI